jgi:cytochrome c biogenesis protein CcmG/thiol:disulfide interchange protein DsbE
VKRNPIIILVVAVVVALMLFAGMQMSKRARAGTNAASLNFQGQPAPEFELKSLDGKLVHLADYRGKAVLLNFWATYCQPCKIEMPWFAEMQNKYGPQGLQIVGVAMDDVSEQEIGKFAQDLGVNYPILIGKESVGDAYGGVQFLPASFYIDRNGKVVDRVFGLKGKADIEADIQKALGQ